VSFRPAELARIIGIDEPTPEQAAVIGAPLRPLAVLAGAGSGKSETMAARLVWLAANGRAEPERVLGLTFTRKAAAELGERVRARLGALRRAGLRDIPAGEPAVSTYHAYAGRLVADHGLREGLEPGLRLITPALAWQLASRIVANYDGPLDAISWAPDTLTEAVLGLAAELAEHLRDPRDIRGTGQWLEQCWAVLDRPNGAARKVLDTQRAREQLLPLVAAYQAAKAAREVMDYADQMAFAARIARRHPEVGKAERDRYAVVLLDEYQDTSHAQLVLLRSLFGGGHPVTAVGDPCQSIYGWRGASAGNLRRFPADFPAGAPGPEAAARPAAVRLLSVSFRNTGRVLRAAAAVQRGLGAEAGTIPVLGAAPGRAGRGTVTCALLETATEEADWVAGQIEWLLRLPPGLAPDGWPWPGVAAGPRARRVRPSDIAVLCRKRSQFPVLRAAIEARGIPVEVVGLGGLLTVPEVADIVATLRVMHDPSANAALARLLTSPRCQIGPSDLAALGRRARDLAARPARDAGAGPMAQAVTDLTAEPGCLPEALDDLGDPAAYSASGYQRLTALAAELRALRADAARPLAELVGEVERVLGLDIEVAARPGSDPVAARADLDAFADAAAEFAGDGDEPTLGAFLAYLTAAEAEEFGLEAGRVGDADTVKIATVHAAKGLQWAAVFVPGLSDGPKAHLFPARPRQSTRWTDNARMLPFPLRGDAADLPVLGGLDKPSLQEFGDACAARDLAEERRLCYVAVTRAAFWLGCSGYWWGAGHTRLGPSVFLAEIRDACAAGAGMVARWAPEPAADAANPALSEPVTATWPAAAAGPRYEAVREAAELVWQALDGLNTGERAQREPAVLDGPGAELADSWARDADLLLAERARLRGMGRGAGRRPGNAVSVELPRRLSVSSLVTLAADPGELAREVRRPMPRPPRAAARRGTAFHRWLEQRFGPQQLIDPMELPGAADSGEDLTPEEDDLAVLRERFEAGEWGGRWPAEVEVPFETRIGDRIVRGRMDAVFADAPGGGFDVVDWKTGKPPSTPAEQRAVAVQLAAYRLAWAALAGVPLEQVRAAFYYVRDDLTVRPADLLDQAGLAALIESVPAA
jgi:DNA helicase-2/ATP-dependent DNA helicase PcrA